MKSKIQLGIWIACVTLALALLPVGTVGTEPAAAQSLCNAAQFVTDVTIPDNTLLQPGTPFVKTWRLRNIGSCTWSTSYSLVFVSGSPMGGSASVNLPEAAAPGATVEVSVSLIAPAASGSYIGFWEFADAAGVRFGIGPAATDTWWVHNLPRPGN